MGTRLGTLGFSSTVITAAGAMPVIVARSTVPSLKSPADLEPTSIWTRLPMPSPSSYQFRASYQAIASAARGSRRDVSANQNMNAKQSSRTRADMLKGTNPTAGPVLDSTDSRARRPPVSTRAIRKLDRVDAAELTPPADRVDHRA